MYTYIYIYTYVYIIRNILELTYDPKKLTVTKQLAVWVHALCEYFNF